MYIVQAKGQVTTQRLEGSVIIRLDGSQALKEAAGSWPLDPHRPDFDLLWSIRKLSNVLPVKLNWEWIRGHQDDNVAQSLLSEAAQDNILCDNIAKALYDSFRRSYAGPPPMVPDDDWSVIVDGEPISCIDEDRLYQHLWGDTTVNYWIHKFQWGSQIPPTVDWDLLESRFPELSIALRRRTTKMASGLLGVGVRLQQWGFAESSDESLRS